MTTKGSDNTKALNLVNVIDQLLPLQLISHTFNLQTNGTKIEASVLGVNKRRKGQWQKTFHLVNTVAVKVFNGSFSNFPLTLYR